MHEREEDYSDYYDYADEAEARERPRDPKTDEAKGKVRDLFRKQPERVFYQRQVEVLLEKDLFHWITVRALGELIEERAIRTELAPLGGGEQKIKFLWAPRLRYWKREAQRIEGLVLEISRLGRAIGAHGETMFDAALPRFGFMPRGQKVRSYGGRDWKETGQDLDRVFERDGMCYGAEIKNTLEYIPHEEMQVKVRMCQELGLTPLFTVRVAPKSYIEEVREYGGFTLVFGYQLYPHGHEGLARRVREGLGIPADSPRAVYDGTVKRLLGWHLETHGLAGP